VRQWLPPNAHDPLDFYQNFTNAREDWWMRFAAPRGEARARADSALQWLAEDIKLNR
jgi:hypothetical protein